jgi:hypothetical protein
VRVVGLLVEREARKDALGGERDRAEDIGSRGRRQQRGEPQRGEGEGEREGEGDGEREGDPHRRRDGRAHRMLTSLRIVTLLPSLSLASTTIW